MPKRGNPNWQPGGKDCRSPGGQGIGGPANGEGSGLFTPDNQPPEGSAIAGKAGKAAMRAFFEEKRLAYAKMIDEIALTDPDSGRRLAALNSIVDRLDGKATQAISGSDGEGPVAMTFRWATEEELSGG